MSGPNKICLVIIFNHRFEKNIPKLYQFYKNRFDNIRIIIPFYRNAEDPRIIRVYENSWNFQGYISQAFDQLLIDEFNQYVFIGDDCLLNPKVDQNNINDFLHLDEDTNFISEIQPLASVSLWWPNFTEKKIGFKTDGVEFFQELPSIENALNKIKKIGLFSNKADKDFIEYQTVNRIFFTLLIYYRAFIARLSLKGTKIPIIPFPKIHKKLPYPLLMGYSDFFIINRKSFDEFSHYCGIFASMRMFAEIAIPTALALSSTKLVDINSTNLQTKAYWRKFRKTDLELLKLETRGNVNEIFEGERENMLWIHPIKLSMWEVK